MRLPCFAALAMTVLLAGCWQSKGSLYGDARPLEPFHAGNIVSSIPDHPDQAAHSILTKAAGGVWRLTNNDKGGSDFGDAFVVRIFALSGLPPGMFVFEAASDDKCKPADTNCHPLAADSPRYYGLVRLTRDGAQTQSPDCDKSAAAAKLPGVKIEDYSTCTFASRAVLEKALLAQARQPWKTSTRYSYQ